MPTQSQRLERLEQQIQCLTLRLTPLRQRSNQLSWLRVATFLGGIMASVAALGLLNPWLFGVVALLSLAALLFVVQRHNRLDQAIARFTIWQQLKRETIARAQLDWQKIPAAPTLSPSPDHPFAADLDLAGEFSLYRLLDCTTSTNGSQRLYAWLSATQPDLAAIESRQSIIRELIPLTVWRNRLLLNARTSANDWGRFEGNDLLRWLQRTVDQPLTRLWLSLSFVLLGLSLLLGLLFLLDQLGPWWTYSYLAYFALQLFAGRSSGESFAQATTIQSSLERLAAVLHHVETFSYRNTPHLRRICATIIDEQSRPSQLLRRVQWIVAVLGVQSNPVVAFICNAIFPWNLYFGERLQRLKAEAGQRLPVWLDTWYELETLNSLATFAWLNPTHQFPTIRQNDQPFVFRAEQLGHPLIPGGAKVCNDFAMEKLGDLGLITGSNMAGKSTFLRTLGLNLALAFAGSVVDATQMESSPLRLFTTIRINDSVTEGVSYFYAEVKRLKRLLDELDSNEPLPLFFCIDEIFRGTNNRERLIGSRSYIRQLVGKRGAGLISTHDLELVKLAEELPAITNYHFRDEIVDEEMVFDYKLHRGPCPTTNALKVMRNAGLPVEE